MKEDKRRFYTAAGLMVAGAVLDSYTTMNNFYSHGIIEGNPVIRASIEYLGAGAGLMAIKATSVALAIYTANKIYENNTGYSGENLLYFGSLASLLGAYANLLLDKYLQYGADSYMPVLY